MHEVVQVVVVEKGPGSVSPKTQVWWAVKGQHTEAHQLEVFFCNKQPGNKAHVMLLMECPQHKDTSLLSVGCVGVRLLGGGVAEKGDLQCVAMGLSGETAPQKPEEHQTQLTVQLPSVGLQVLPSPSPCFDCIPVEGSLALQKRKDREGGEKGRRKGRGRNMTAWVT